MAIKIYDKFAPRANPGDTNYPNGSIKNESVTGAKDGTPLDAVWGNDYAGFDAALFAEAGITPSGSADTAVTSQRLEALKKIGGRRVTTVAEIATGVLKVNDGLEIADRKSVSSTVKSGGSANGSTILDAGGGNTSEIDDALLLSTEQAALVPQTFCGFTDIEPTYVSDIKNRADMSIDSDGFTVKNRSIKAWKQPKGVKDGAVAGSFILHNGTTEPETQVSGFANVNNIGQQMSRDAVAVFGQVNSAIPLLITSNTTFTGTSVTSADITALFDSIEIGMIADVNYGTVGWVGGVVTSKTAPSTLNINSWRAIDGASGLGATPSSGAPLTINRHSAIWGANFNAIIGSNSAGANQAIGIEVGVSCAKKGSGTNSRGYYAVNLGGETPEYAYTLTGGWQKGYTSINSTVYGFSSTNDLDGMRIFTPSRYAILTKAPIDSHIHSLSPTDIVEFGVKAGGIMHVGYNANSGTARVNVRGRGTFGAAYDATEINVFDPSTTLADRSGFYVSQAYGASSGSASCSIGVGNSSNHTYSLNIKTGGVNRMIFSATGAVNAGADNTQTLGSASLRWSEIFAGNGAINTSDERLKEFRPDFLSAEKITAIKLKSLLTSFKWIESLERESNGGSKARIHVGIGAQALAKAFSDNGLDASDYAMFCYDKWDEVVETRCINPDETIEESYTEEVQKTELITELVTTESIDLVDGNYVLVKKVEEKQVEKLVFDTHNVYDQSGNEIYDTKTLQDGSIASIKKVTSIPAMIKTTKTRTIKAKPVFEDVVITKAGDRFGVRLDQVLAFILANT